MKKNDFFKNLLYLSVAFLSMGLLRNILAKHVTAKTERKFGQLINKARYNLAIALFYESEKRMRRDNPELYRKLKDAKETFKNTSNVFKYDDSDLLFVTVNLARKKSSDLKNMYGIKSTPVSMLFKDGYPYKDKAGNLQTLDGFKTRPQLQKFIDENFEKNIAKNRKRNQEIRKKRAEEARARAYYWGPGWGLGGYGGYGGWGYGGYGGWGGYGRGWGYGGYGRGWGGYGRGYGRGGGRRCR